MPAEKLDALHRSLEIIDRIRRRVLMGGWLAVLVTLGVYTHFYYLLGTTESVPKIAGAGLLALTCLIAWTSFATILIVVRMTGKVLRAMEHALE